MMLTELTAVPGAALPLAAFKDHLRMGTGFALPPGQDALLEGYLRSAIAAIEGRISKALIGRSFSWTIEAWRDPAEQALPIAPVSALLALNLLAADGTPTEVPAAQYRLIADLHRPRIAGTMAALPAIPTNGQAEITFVAGFGPAWADVPADLQQAVLLLASEYYEHRHDDSSATVGMPFGVVTLIERWRLVRVLGGRGRP